MKLLFLFILQSLAEDYYKLLGVDRFADEKAIRKSFKKLSLAYHPDRGNRETQNHYMQLSQAYEVLTCPAKREVYDKFGEEGILRGGLRYNVDEIYENYFGIEYPGKQRWWNPMYQGTKVIEITDHSIHLMNNRNEMWMVLFYGTRSSKSREFSGIWMNLANRMDSFCKFAAVNCDINEDLCKDYSVRKYPVVYKLSPDRSEEPVLYKGPKDYSSLNDYLLSNIPGKISSVTVANFQQFLTNDLEKPKILLFTNLKEHVLTLKAVAHELEDKVLFGEVEPTQSDLLRKYEVNFFPYVVSINNNGYEKYAGPFMKYNLADWAKRILKDHEVLSISKELNSDAFDLGNCNKNDSKFCFIAFDPDQQMRDVLNHLVAAFVSDPVNVFWVNSNVYPQVLAEFGYRNVIVRGKKGKFSPVLCASNDILCFKEAIVNSLNGAREFVPLRRELKFRLSDEL